MTDLGSYGSIDRLVVVTCDGRLTTTTSGVDRRSTGKVTTEHLFTAVYIDSGT